MSCSFFPSEYDMKAYPLSMYPAKCQQAACIQMMIMNNLDPSVAQFPQELVTYGGNGSVFSNWAQYHLIMYYLSHMTEEQTLSMYSGHPMGLFPSHPDAPRMVITNGMVIPNYSSQADYERMYAQGVTIYGQMTAGSYCYIGPQGIVHGTTITVMNAGRKYLKLNDLSGKVFVTAGLGGMSGAQGKASLIAGAVGVIAEIDPAALEKRYKQGWISEKITDLDTLIVRIKEARKEGKPIAIGYLGNVVDVWERLAEEDELLVELGSDQTSLHNPWMGGYYPVQLTFEESRAMMHEDPAQFKKLVQESLRRQAAAINKLAARGMYFWDYGNSFLLEASRAGADVLAKEGDKCYGVGGFKYPSYVQDIMGDIFSLGFGPFRWVCTSGLESDLEKTDEIAAKIFRDYISQNPAAPIASQLQDNLHWIEHAGENKLVVGSQARILYADCYARTTIARAFNAAVARGELTAPVVISRDHHDVSGTDSPFRETSNIQDGSAFCADMAVQNCIGDALRGATWVALHNGGGVGWGEVMNGGFGMVLDGRKSTEVRLERMLFWDVINGVARRAWSGNSNARLATDNARAAEPRYEWTDANWATEETLKKIGDMY